MIAGSARTMWRACCWTIATAAGACLLGTAVYAAEPSAGQAHWAYEAPVRPAVPSVLPDASVRQPLDAFIQQTLARHQLRPAAAASRSQLLRRLSLTLHGLFPDPQEVASFEQARAPDAYEQQVDRLLASPRYGQHMATDWLDLARYADTNGYHADTEREHWRWRDWVVERLNEGQPFDQFTIEQLAGDLLPNATLSQQIATGFLRNNMVNDEVGAIPEEFLAEYAIDRVHTVGTTWLGQTWSCARCHDHKYEPVSQREFYRLFAFFNSLEEPAILVKGSPLQPSLEAPAREQQARLEQIDARLATINRALAAREEDAADDQLRWEAQAKTIDLKAPPGDAAVDLPLDGEQPANTTAKTTSDRARPAQPAKLHGITRWAPGQIGDALLLNGETRIELPHVAPLSGANAWTLCAWIFPTTRDDMVIAKQADEALYQRGWQWNLVDGKLQIRLTHKRGEDELVVQSKEAVPLSRWQHVAVRFDPQRPQDVQLWLQGKPMATESAGKFPAAGIVSSGPLQIGGADKEEGFRGLLDEVQFYGRALSDSELQILGGGNPLAAILLLPAAERTPAQRASLKRYYLAHHDPEHQRLKLVWRQELTQRALLEQEIPSVLVARELAKPRPAHVLLNGQYDQLGEVVPRQTPAYLSKQVTLTRPDRLGLARWLVDPRHPLTGRVGANRAWKQVFGTGLVDTPEDFGLRGARPTHPELLDWLAREWVDRGWDTKRLHRQLVTSATFRQRSEVTAESLASDPHNRLLSRGPRGRLSAEVIRDSLLGAAGLLSLRQSGPGVRPYQPGDLWRDLAMDFQGLTAQTYVPTTGAEMYRRSLYLYWKRTSPPVNMSVFDAVSRETCTASRSVTNTPLQSLVLLNDPTFVEAARVLALRVLRQPELSTEQRIEQLLLYTLARKPTAEEQTLLQKQLAADLKHYHDLPAEADQLLQVGQAFTPHDVSHAELAAWANLASIVLNLDETITNH
jgi:hypothetical protein